MTEDIFDLTVAISEKDFIKTGLQLEGEVASDILTVLGKFPYLGSLIKLGRLSANYMDLQFVRKLAKFLQKSEDIPVHKKELFLQNLDKKQRKKLFEYLIHLLYAAESEEKAELMGIIYKERILNHIDDLMLLRLCSIINKSFVEDLKNLGSYVTLCDKNDYTTDNLCSCGLILIPPPSVKGDGINFESRYTLSIIGKSLYKILKSANWLK